MFCFHKYGEPKERYQTCKKCGKVIIVPCAHQWKNTQNIGVDEHGTNTTIAIIKEYSCIHCGEVKSVKIEN